MSLAATVGVWLLAALMPSPVSEESGPTVRWDAPTECGSAQALRERLAEQLGAQEASIEIVGRVTHESGVYALDLELTVGGEQQGRSFSASAEDCQTLLDAAVLVSSAALGPERSFEEERPTEVEPSPEAEAEPEPPPEVAPEPEPPPEVASEPEPAAGESPAEPSADPDPRRRSPAHWLASTQLGVGYDGALLTVGGTLGVGVAWRRLRVELHAAAMGNRARETLGDLDLAVLLLDPRACAVLHPSPAIELLPCGGLAVGPAIGVGRDLPNGRRAVVPWMAVHGDFGARWVARPRLAVGLELSAYAMVMRPRYTLSDGETVFRMGPAGGRALFVIELRFSATD